MSQLLVVTGAPGSGKTTTAEFMAGMSHEFSVFDIDWLIDQGSNLVGKRIQDAPELWSPWAQLWFEVLHCAIKNGNQPIFFCPNTPLDFQHFGLPDWCREVRWFLLDCSDASRRSRLQSRNWSCEAIDSALSDARELRSAVSVGVSTDDWQTPAVAEEVLSWARKRLAR
jgi:energy-coupling factor transporter ATP-binding protein EcfA2